MKRMMTVGVLLLSLCTVARADDASKRATAEKLIAVMHAEKMIDGVVDALKGQSAQMLQGAPQTEQMNPEQKKLFIQFQDQMIAMVMNEVKSKMMPQMADVYAKTFSEDELNAMFTFYSSPIGQSVIEKTPQVMQNSMASMGDIMKDVMPKIQAMADAFGKKVQAAATPPKAT